MKLLSKLEFEKLTADARVLSKDKHGLKVLEVSDGRIFKIFRLKRAVSSARFYPYAKRFADNAKILEQLSIPTVKVRDIFSVPEMKRDVVIYEPLIGTTLRDQIKTGANDCLKDLPLFIAQLHRAGVFFRSIHFGNIVVLPNGRFGLIDVADLQWKKWRGLWVWERVRNFRHLTKYKVDKDALNSFGITAFVGSYLQASNNGALQSFFLRKTLLR